MRTITYPPMPRRRARNRNRAVILAALAIVMIIAAVGVYNYVSGIDANGGFSCSQYSN